MKVADLSEGDLVRRIHGGLSWRVGPYSVRVTTPLAFVARELGFLYRDFRLLDDEHIVDADVSVRPAGFTGRRVSIFSDGCVLFGRVPWRQAVPLLEWTLNLSVFHRPTLNLLLHAAVVERDGRAAILPGEAGSGKSTLCAALVHRGWRLLSDEVAVIRTGDGRLLAVPRPVSLKEDSIAVIRRFAPQARLGPTWPETPKGSLAHLVPPSSSVHRMDEPADPAWIVFPEFHARAAVELEPLPKADALLHCAGNAFNYSVLGSEGFERLARLIDACDCYELLYGDLESVIDVFDQLQPPVAPLQVASCASIR